MGVPVRERRARRRLRVHTRVVVLLLGAIVLVGVIRLCHPYALARRQEEEIARLRAQKSALQAEHDQLQAYKHDLASDRGQESTLRRQGYIRPGERPLVFVKQKPPEAKQKPPEQRK